MTRIVLDASAILALLLDEPGADQVMAALAVGLLSTVNASEVIERLTARGHAHRRAVEMLDALGLDVADFTYELAVVASGLAARTRGAGLSLGDRACLALALQTRQPVLTADRAWATVNVGVDVQQIR